MAEDKNKNTQDENIIHDAVMPLVGKIAALGMPGINTATMVTANTLDVLGSEFMDEPTRKQMADGVKQVIREAPEKIVPKIPVTTDAAPEDAAAKAMKEQEKEQGKSGGFFGGIMDWIQDNPGTTGAVGLGLLGMMLGGGGIGGLLLGALMAMVGAFVAPQLFGEQQTEEKQHLAALTGKAKAHDKNNDGEYQQQEISALFDDLRKDDKFKAARDTISQYHDDDSKKGNTDLLSRKDVDLAMQKAGLKISGGEHVAEMPTVAVTGNSPQSQQQPGRS